MILFQQIRETARYTVILNGQEIGEVIQRDNGAYAAALPMYLDDACLGLMQGVADTMDGAVDAAFANARRQAMRVLEGLHQVELDWKVVKFSARCVGAN